MFWFPYMMLMCKSRMLMSYAIPNVLWLSLTIMRVPVLCGYRNGVHFDQMNPSSATIPRYCSQIIF